MMIRTGVITLILTLAAAALAQTAGALGTFEGASDVGNPALKGSVAFNSSRGEYRITGGGANIWAKSDEFQFLWRKLSGNVAMTATMQFVGSGGAPHRKAGLMLRASLEPDAPYVDAVVHGDGLTNLQSREVAGDITRAVRFPVQAPTQIRLERRGAAFSLWTAKAGEPLQEAGSIQVPLGNGPVYAGLFVCSHDPKTVETVVFTNVSIESLPAVTKKAQ
jgi:hypothetical protein